MIFSSFSSSGNFLCFLGDSQQRNKNADQSLLSGISGLLYICLLAFPAYYLLLLLLLRQESLKQAERERRMKYKKQDDEREVIRSSIRDKVGGC